MSVEELSRLADQYKVRPLANFVLEDKRFPLWSGSSKSYQHHYGKGGLCRHTLEVVELCLLNNKFFDKIGKGVNEQSLFLAALFHDSGKMWDYTPLDADYKDWQGNEHKRQIHHISRSGLLWHDAVHKAGMFLSEHDTVLHAILAHHGLREWGSPVAPATRLAWLLHLCDGMSARIDDCDSLDLFGKQVIKGMK